MKYVYFVSYTGKDNEGNKIYGRSQLTRNKEITNLEDIEGIEEDFYDKYNNNIIVNNYILMRKEEE